MGFWRNAAHGVYRGEERKGGPPATCHGRNGGSISSPVREPPGLHASIHATASGNGAALLFPAESAGRASAARAGPGNIAATPGRRTHTRLVFDQSEDSAVKVGRYRRRL